MPNDVLLAVENLKPHGEPELFGPSGLSFQLHKGEFVVLLGKSGHGKSTVLESVLGVRGTVQGKITFYKNGDEVPIIHGKGFRTRQFGMLFQDHGLFELKQARANVTYPLAVRKVKKVAAQEKVTAVLTQLDIDPGLLDRHIDQLSGGERQRIALARLLVVERTLYLFDEPLASIDNPLRQKLVDHFLALKEKLRERETGALYVTHSQSEALCLADRIIVLKAKEGIVQDGVPEEIYCCPKTRYVAEFVGDPLYNLLPVVADHGTLKVPGSDTPLSVRTGDQTEPLTVERMLSLVREESRGLLDRGHVALGFRPELLRMRAEGTAAALELNLKLLRIMYQGEEFVIRGRVEPTNWEVRMQTDAVEGAQVRPGCEIRASVELHKHVDVFHFDTPVLAHDYEGKNDGENVTANPATGGARQ